MELCHGTLRDYIDNKVEDLPVGSLDDRSILSQIVVGLGYLHGKNIIHKDLKPGNILLQKKDHGHVLWKLADFGFSRRKAQSNEEFDKTDNIGTRGYIAPELCSSNQPTFASDAWALGVVCFFIVSKGKHPYEIPGFNMEYVQIPIDIFKLAPGLQNITHDWAAADLICRLLHKQPEKRPNIFTIIYHPFFALSNQITKKHLAFKIFDFWLKKHDGKYRSPMNDYFKERNLKEWYEQYEKELGSEGSPEELERISNFVTVFL